jgi:YVTN family beta-propeller protein/VCBS repeat-containing protein
VTLTATASDNVAVTGVKFYVDNIQIGSTDTTSPYSASWDTKLVTNGIHTLKAEASDAAGNTNTSTRTVTVANPDITAPTVSLTAPAGDVTVSGPITLSATATDNVGVAGVQFKLDEVNLGAEDTTPDANGYSVVWDTATVSNGSYRLTAVARDAAGNITTTSTRTVIVANPDTVAPTVNLTAPADLAGVTGTVTLSATATDNVGVAGVQFLVNGTPLGAEDTTPDPDGGYSVVWDTATVADGTYTLTAQARDTAGNTGTSTVTVAVVTPDTVAPTLSLTAPANGATLSGTVTLSATATDNVGVREVQFIVDGAPILTDSSSPYSAVWNTHLVSNGTHTLTARAHDAAGNMTYSTVTITVDNINSAPVASPTLFSQDPLTGAVTGWVNATDSDGNVLSYTVTAAPAGGTVWVNPKTGSYTYIPSQAARLAADQTVGLDTDTFTVTVSDGKDSTSTVVTVPISPATLTPSQTTTPVGSGAAGIAIRGRYAVVANQGADTVSVIDTTTGAVIATLPVGDAPTSVATIYNGTFAFVTNQGSNTVSVINTYDNTVYKTIGVGAQPWGVVQSTSLTEVVPGTWSRAVYVTNSGSNTVSVIETLNYTVAATIPVGSNPTGVAVSADGTRVYVANKASNTVSVIDAASKTVIATVPVGTNPVGVAVNAAGTRVYVTNLNGTVSVINTAMPTPTVVATVPVGPQPYSVALSPDSRLAYVANSNDTISVIDTGTNTVLRTVTMDTAPESGTHFLALDPYGRVYTTDAFDAVVRSLSVSPSASTELPITSTAITVGSNPTVTAVNGSHAYVLNQGSHTISVIDTVTKQVVKTIPVSASAYDMVVAPNDQRIYVANGDTVSVIDTATGNEVVPPISIPNLCADGSCWGSAGGLYDLAISPDGSRVYALRGYATMGGNFSAVSLIDTATNSVITTNVTDWLYDIEAAGNGTLLYGAYGESYFATRPFVTVFDAVTLGGFAYIPVSTAEAVGTEYATGEYAAAVATSPDGKRAYAIVTSKYVAVIDTDPGSATYNTQIGQIAVPFGVQSVAVSPDNRRLYISLSDGKTVEVVDTTTNAVLGYFTKPSSGAMTVGPDGTLYLIDNANGKVYAVTVGSTTVL